MNNSKPVVAAEARGCDGQRSGPEILKALRSFSQPRTSAATTTLAALLFALPLFALAADPLPSWNEGPAKKSIIEFVETVTTPDSKGFVKPEARIAVFDNDGTLWSEQPGYFEELFAFDEIKRMAPQHPEWKDQQPFKAVIENDHKALAESGMEGLLKIFMASHAGSPPMSFATTCKPG